ncbi:hypothetical protein [Crocosphaera chwakensis]|uniref:Uncharacterized protein n=1 Tax=Crocosphaera chwakensis CCY0110 TaxID=391612 RepID=A3IR62_9CHRO|nr:hypothetical protein [Crocosphaera chwakensis]EAZ91052.1 hypothetical protein CY0110_27610 [Crocosphaera chwakensis CCY0110]
MDTATNKIKKIIERALADGRLSSQEDEDIKAAIRSDQKVTEEAMKLYRELQQQIFEGEIIIDD